VKLASNPNRAKASTPAIVQGCTWSRPRQPQDVWPVQPRYTATASKAAKSAQATGTDRVWPTPSTSQAPRISSASISNNSNLGETNRLWLSDELLAAAYAFKTAATSSNSPTPRGIWPANHPQFANNALARMFVAPLGWCAPLVVSHCNKKKCVKGPVKKFFLRV
jgi:hypothetical protein